MFEIPLNNPISYDISLVSVITADTPTPTLSPSPPPSNDSNDAMDGSGSDKCLLNYPGTACTSHLGICSGQMTINSYDSLYERSIPLFPILITSQDCKDKKDEVEEFLCRVAFQPCDSNSYIHLPNKTTCENIRDKICQREWESLQNITMNSSLLPNCSLLPDVSTPPTCGKL